MDSPPAPDRRPPTRDRSTALAWLLDSSIRLPGTRIRIGLDPLIGLIPGAGDFIASCLGMFLVADAIRHRAPAAVLVRMGANVLVNHAGSLVPVAGDLFSFWFKSNERNLRLLNRWKSSPATTARRSRWTTALIVAALAAIVLALLVLGIALAVTGYRYARDLFGW